MPEPAFLVEGLMEKLIVQRLCPGKVVRLIGCNSDSASMETVGKFVISQIKLMNNRFYPIVIVFDRERRKESRNNLVMQMQEILDAQGYQGQYVIGIPDRTTEYWMLSDSSAIGIHYDLDVTWWRYEEGNKKGDIYKIIGSKKECHETTDGVDIFTRIDPDVVYAKSSSFRELVDNLADIECWWLEAIAPRAPG